jgi:hypothetical protein
VNDALLASRVPPRVEAEAVEGRGKSAMVEVVEYVLEERVGVEVKEAAPPKGLEALRLAGSGVAKDELASRIASTRLGG